MATNTSKGIVYPTSGDSIAPLESHFAELANTVNDALVLTDNVISNVDDDLQAFKAEVGLIPQSGELQFTGPTSSTTPVNVTISLPTGYFTNAPIITTNVSGASGSSGYFAVLHSVVPNEFQARIWRTTGTTAETLKLNWIAIG